MEEGEEGEHWGRRDMGKDKPTEYQSDTGVFTVGDWSIMGATGDGNGQICSRPPPYAGARQTEASEQSRGGQRFFQLCPASQPRREAGGGSGQGGTPIGAEEEHH